jgi:hypothetical protein
MLREVERCRYSIEMSEPLAFETNHGAPRTDRGEDAGDR